MLAMEVRRFCTTSNVVIVVGKGGVGKTTVSAALALTAARAGLRVLVVEMEGKSGLPSMFGAPPLAYDELPLTNGIQARFLTPDAALVDYLVSHGMKRISKRLVASGALEVVATAVPGMKDILVLGKVKSLEESRVADLLIVDAPAAGHAVTFLLSARGLLDAVRVGPIRKQATDVVDLISDPARCQVFLVTTPEETPISESIETAYAIEDRAGVALGPIVVNGCFAPIEAGIAEHDSVDAVLRDADAAGRFVSEREARDLARAMCFRAERHRVQHEQIERLSHRLPLPQITLPFVFTPDIGPPQLDVLADAMQRGIELFAEST
jgi:anion-transporting  ArsA/GET3 family ATPase